jgi:hypothetical protein
MGNKDRLAQAGLVWYQPSAAKGPVRVLVPWAKWRDCLAEEELFVVIVWRFVWPVEGEGGIAGWGKAPGTAVKSLRRLVYRSFPIHN